MRVGRVTGVQTCALPIVVDDHIGALSAHTGDANSNGLLDVGETWTYTANGTAVSGQSRNLRTAAGTGNISNTPMNHRNPHYSLPQINPAINIVMLTNGTNNDAPTGPHLEVLDNVNWTYIVTNPGNEPLTGVTVTDNVVGPITNFAGGDTNSNGRLDVGETWTYTANGTAVLGQYGNVGTARGTGYVSNQPVSNTNPDYYFGDSQADTTCPAGSFEYSVGGSISGIDPGTGDLYIKFDQFPAPNDNSYGVNAVGWPEPRGHLFKDQINSDHAGFQLRDPNGVVKLSFDIDYLTASTVTAATPSGYESLGPFGGDGRVVTGTLTPADLTWDTSLARNLNTRGYCTAGNCTTGGVNLLVDSPPTDATHTNYAISNPALLQWNFHYTYFVTIKKAKLQSIGFLNANGNPVPGWVVELNPTALHNSPAKPCPGNTIIPATGGAAISADTAATGAFTTLTGPVYAESNARDVSTGTIIINAPDGLVFDTGGTPPTVLSVKMSGSGNNPIQGSVTAVTPTQITYAVTAVSANPSQLTWQNIRVRPALGTPLADGNLTRSGTASMAGLSPYANFGTLKEVAGAASGLVILTQPSATATAGAPFARQPVLEVRDQFGSVLNEANCDGVSGTVVTAARLAGSGALQGTTSMATAADGTVTFTNLSHNVAANITIQFTSTGATPSTSSLIAVSAASATRLTFTTQPGNAAVGSVFGSQPVVRTEDQFGNASTAGLGANRNLSLSLTGGTGPLQGTASFDVGTDAGNGTATFTDLRIDAAGAGKQLTASASGLTSALSAVFTVNPGPAASLAIQTQPTAVTAGVTFSPAPAVRILDAFGNLATTSSAVVTATLNLGTATLQGTASVPTVNGVATFANLSYSKAETITIDFTSGTLNPTSASVTVNPAAASKLTIQTQPSGSATAGMAFAQQPVIRIEDVLGNLRSSDNSTVVTAARSAGSGALQGDLTATAVNGV